MTCREIPTGVLGSARSLEDVYSQLGVLRGPDGSPLPPQDLIRPDGIPPASFSYLGGTEGRDYNLAGLYDNGQAGLNCVLSSLGYNEARARAIDAEITELGNDEDAIERRLNELSVGDRRTYSIYTTLKVIDYFRTTGNTDGNQNVVSMQEIADWAWERCGHDRDTHQATATPAIRRLHAFLGLAIFLSRDVPPTDRAGVTLVPGSSFNLVAPEGGWRAGDKVFVGTTEITGVPASGTGVMTIGAASLPIGTHAVEIRRVSGAIERTNVIVQAPPAPEQSWLAKVPGWVWGVSGTAAVIGIIAGIRRLVGGREATPTTPPPPPGTTPPSNKVEVRVESGNPQNAAPAPAPAVVVASGSTPPPGTVEFVIGKEPGERGGIDGFTLSNLPDHVAKMVSRNHLLVRIEGDRYLVQEIGQNAGIASIDRAGTRIAIPRATDANPWVELVRGDAINIAGAVRLPFSGAPATGASPVSPFAQEVIAPGGAPAVAAAPAVAPAPAQAQPQPAAPRPAPAKSALDQALDGLDSNDVAIAEIPNVTTINAEAIERQIRFLFPELDNVRYNAIVQDLADEALHRLQGLGGEDFKTEFQHELNTYRDAIRGAAPTRFLIRTIEERLAVHRRSVETARAAELIRIAEDDRAHAGRREELRDVFRRATNEASRRAVP